MATATTVRCSGADHVIALGGDDLILCDHDEVAEAVLDALGGDRPSCLRLAALWRDPPWHDAVPCLLLDEDGAAAAAAGKGAAADGLASLVLSSTSAIAAHGVDRLRDSALLLGLPAELRRASARRALGRRVERWQEGTQMDPTELWLLERQLDPVFAERLLREGRHIPPGGRPVRVHLIAPGGRPSLVPGRRRWDAVLPIDVLADVLADAGPLSPSLGG